MDQSQRDPLHGKGEGSVRQKPEPPLGTVERPQTARRPVAGILEVRSILNHQHRLGRVLDPGLPAAGGGLLEVAPQQSFHGGRPM